MRRGLERLLRRVRGNGGKEEGKEKRDRDRDRETEIERREKLAMR